MQAQRKDEAFFIYILGGLGFIVIFLPNILFYQSFIFIIKTFCKIHSTSLSSWFYLPCYILSFVPTYVITDTFSDSENYRNFLKNYIPIFNIVRITVVIFILPSIILYFLSFGSQIINELLFYGISGAIIFWGVRNSYEFKTISRLMKFDLNNAKTRIVHLHDMNLNLVRNSYFMEELIKEINFQHPDVVVITGELIKDDNSYGGNCLNLLSRVKVPIVYNGTNTFNKVPDNFHCITEEGYVEINELIFMKTKSKETFAEDLKELKSKLKKKKAQMKVLLHNNYMECSGHQLKDYNISLVLTGFEEYSKNVVYSLYDYWMHADVSEFYGEDVYYFVNYGMNLLYNVMRFNKNHIGVIDIEGKSKNKAASSVFGSTKKVPWFKKLFSSKSSN